MGSGVPTEDGQVELISLWVSPNARGRGVGDAILAEVERWARDRGAGALRLDVAEDNEGAARLYLRHGFAWTGELGELRADGVRRERVMAKPLDDRVGPTA
jgi:ribosomal protein S18 acetylase RimI-like enzyme